MKKTSLIPIIIGCFLLGCTGAQISESNAIAADAQTILNKAQTAVQTVNTIAPSKQGTTVQNSLYAFSALVTAYQGLTMPSTSISTGTPAVDAALKSLTAAGVPITAKDVATVNTALAMAGGIVTPTSSMRTIPRNNRVALFGWNH